MEDQALKSALDRARFEGEVSEQLRTLFLAVAEIKELLSRNQTAIEGRVSKLELWRSYTAGYIAASTIVSSVLTAVALKFIG